MEKKNLNKMLVIMSTVIVFIVAFYNVLALPGIVIVLMTLFGIIGGGMFGIGYSRLKQ